jgi:hypothetical protein
MNLYLLVCIYYASAIYVGRGVDMLSIVCENYETLKLFIMMKCLMYISEIYLTPTFQDQ